MKRLNLAGADIVFLDEPRFFDLNSLSSARRLVYRATDLYAQMRNDSSLVCAERALCRRADRLVATSEPVAEHLRSLSGREVAVITNGVDFDRFANQPESSDAIRPILASLPGSRSNRAIYVGAFDDRFGVEAIAWAADGHPGRTFILAGPGSQRCASELNKPNVVGIGSVAYETVPALLHSCAIGLLPMVENRANSGRSPMKLYEYIASGLPVAATCTPELSRRSLSSLFLGRGCKGFSAAVSRAFDAVGNVQLLDGAKVIAFRESWDFKARELLRWIEE